jgi:hypothetical protein
VAFGVFNPPEGPRRRSRRVFGYGKAQIAALGPDAPGSPARALN